MHEFDIIDHSDFLQQDRTYQAIEIASGYETAFLFAHD
jgi:hypothetical protein